MLSFHNDQSVKDKYLSRVRAHATADAIMQGTGWRNGKGCAVGCTLENYDHSRYPIELGIPEWLARVEDTLFEGMAPDRAKLWPVQFLEAVPLGVDLDPLRYDFLLVVLKKALATQEKNTNFDQTKYPEVAAAIAETVNVLKTCVRLAEAREPCGSDKWSAARSAAKATWLAALSATRSAEKAAWSAARSAEEAAWSATRSPGLSAWLATRSVAWSAAWAAAREAHETFAHFADELITILRNAKGE